MTSFGILLNRLIGLASCFAWLPPLLARVTVGWVFVISGWGKLQHLDKVVSFFESLGIPAPHLQAPFVAGTEFICGILLLAGLFTRLASIPLMATMAVAILTAKKDELHGYSDLIGFSEYLYMLLLFWLVIQGAGRLSADAIVVKRLRKLG